jgi:hypothetical protein
MQLQAERAQTADPTKALHERDTRLTTLSRDRQRALDALSSAETRLEAAPADTVKQHARQDADARACEPEAALREQVHALQQSSALKEVQLVHLTKLCARDREDLNGMNIALDSKQQEVQLVRSSFVFFLFLILEVVLIEFWSGGNS